MEPISQNAELSISPELREPALDFILSNYLKSGFGTLNKSEIDLIFFSALFQFADAENSSDYALSKHLHITQQRVRNLKEKASVKYLPFTLEQAVQVLTQKARHARIEDQYIDIPIYDVRVKTEIEALLEAHNMVMHTQLNPKIFRIRSEDFFELFLLIAAAENPQADMDDIRTQLEEHIRAELARRADVQKRLSLPTDDAEGLAKLDVKKALFKGGLKLGLDMLLALLPGGSIISSLAFNFISALAGQIDVSIDTPEQLKDS